MAPLTALPALARLLVLGHRRSAARFAELASLAAARTLQVLHLKRVRPLRSLESLRRLAELRSITFERSEIEDGDLNVLLALPGLTRVRITPRRKHYAPALDEIDEHLRGRLPPGEYKPRPPWHV